VKAMSCRSGGLIKDFGSSKIVFLKDCLVAVPGRPVNTGILSVLTLWRDSSVRPENSAYPISRAVKIAVSYESCDHESRMTDSPGWVYSNLFFQLYKPLPQASLLVL
jgi:hypothetical protein